MIIIQYGNGQRQVFHGDDGDRVPELKLAIACYADNYQEVLRILTDYPNVDVNAAVRRLGVRGNGTPLVLTGSKAIAELLVKYGARVNHPCNYSHTSDKTITPLDSALRELTKLPVRNSSEKTAQIKELIAYLESLGAMRSPNLYLE